MQLQQQPICVPRTSKPPESPSWPCCHPGRFTHHSIAPAAASALNAAAAAHAAAAADEDGNITRPRSGSQAMRRAAPKPHALTSLGVAGAAAASRKAAAAAALAALEASAAAPKALASELTGPALTVTGTTGARVYCQVVRPTAVAASAGSARGGGRSGLLQQSIDVLLDVLAARRRQVHRVCVGTEAFRHRVACRLEGSDLGVAVQDSTASVCMASLQPAHQ